MSPSTPNKYIRGTSYILYVHGQRNTFTKTNDVRKEHTAGAVEESVGIVCLTRSSVYLFSYCVYV